MSICLGKEQWRHCVFCEHNQTYIPLSFMMLQIYKSTFSGSPLSWESYLQVHVFLLYSKEISCCVCLSEGIKSEGKTVCALEPAASLFMRRSAETESAPLFCSRSEGAYAIEAAQAGKIQTLPCLRGSPSRRLINRIELVLETCVTQAQCHALKTQHAKWFQLAWRK